MILHTIVPPELIFPDNDQGFQNQNTIIRQGIPLVVEQEGNMYKVVRIISSNPSDFLRNDLCPGAYIPLYE